MRRGLCGRPETVHASPLADRTPPFGGGVCGHYYATRHYAHSARRSDQGVLQIVRALLHLKNTITLRCLSVTALSLIDRYHIWNGRIRKIPSGSAMAADAIIPNRHWQHSDETDCPSRNWRTHVLIAFIRSRDSLTSME